MSRMVSVRTEELTGPALGWAIESVEGAGPPTLGQLHLALSASPVDDAQCERLIAKYAVWVEPSRGAWVADTKRDPFERVHGGTRAVAVCRAVLAAAIGKTISIPAELT